jgi:hypothetical protein
MRLEQDDVKSINTKEKNASFIQQALMAPFFPIPKNITITL